MPKIAELREIDGAIWARVEMGCGSPIALLSPEEIEANRKREMAQLDEIERLQTAITQALAVCEDNPNMAHNFIADVLRQALNQ